MGVSQIMREGIQAKSSWHQARFDVESDSTNPGNLFYPRSMLNKHKNEKADHKPGAIETGHADNFKMPIYPEGQYAIEQEQYLLQYPKSKLHEHDGEHAEHKPGAIEIGKANYKTAKFDIDNSIQQKQYALYHPLSELHKRDSEKSGHKEGAIEIGSAEGFHEAQYSVDWDPIKNSQYRLYYNPSDLKKNWTKRNNGPKKGGVGALGKKNSNIPSYSEKKLSPKKSNNIRKRFVKTESKSISDSLSSQAASSRDGLWPEFSSETQFKSRKHLQASGLSLGDDFLDDNLNNKPEKLEGATSLHEQKTCNEIVSEEEVNDYLPRNFSSIRGSTVTRSSTKGTKRIDLPEGRSNMEVSSNCLNTQSGEDDIEHDIFSEEILSFARDSFEKRRISPNKKR